MSRLVPGVAVAVLVVAGLLLARDAAALDPLLRDVEDGLERAQQQVVEGDQEAALLAVGSAAAGVAQAEERVDGPLWSVAGFVPRYGASARAATQGVALADATVELAGAGIEQAVGMLEGGAATFVSPDGRIETTALARATEVLDGLPLAPVRAARDELAALPTAGLIGPTRAARDAAVSRATDVIDQVQRARIGADAFSSFLGGDGPRTHLLAIQNPAELRGTGGLISYMALVTVDEGRLEIGAPDEQLARDVISRHNETFELDVDDPVERSAAFAERYDSNAGGAIIEAVNLDPDLPTVGPVLSRLYEDRTGTSVDGAILVDPFALAEILGASGGPLEVPEFARSEAPSLPAELTADNVAQTLLVDVYDAFGGENPVRHQFDDAVTQAVLQRLFGGDWDPAVMARSLADAASARRLQLYSADESEQAGFRELGIAGDMTAPDETLDVLAVTGNNAGPDKSDAHVSHRLTARLTLRARPDARPQQVRRDGEVTVEVHNPLRPDEHDDYITGTNEPVPVGSGPSPRVRDALNRTWFTIWTPGDSQLTAARDGVNGRLLATGSIHGHDAIDYFLETPSQSTAAFSASYTGPVGLRRAGGRYVYELELWRQAKAIPDVWDLSITPPAGLVVDEVETTGGGDPSTGLGPAEPIRLAPHISEQGDARITGSVTTDVTVKIWMTAD